MLTHIRYTYSPTSIMRCDRVLFMAQLDIHCHSHVKVETHVGMGQTLYHIWGNKHPLASSDFGYCLGTRVLTYIHVGSHRCLGL